MVKEALPPKPAPPKPVGVAVPQEKTAEQIVEENAELLAIDFDRDADALKEAIGEDILAMWKDQGLYQDMPDLRNEMLKGIVNTKFEALREEQAQVLAKKELASMPKVMSDSASERMTMIIEEEEEESSEEEEEEEPEEEEEAQEESDGEDYAMSAIRATKSPVLRALANSANLENHIGSMTKEEQIAIRAFQVRGELQSKLDDMDRSYQSIVEATGRLGTDKEEEKEISIKDYQAFNRFKLHHALQQRVSAVFTEDHHVVTGSDEEDEEEVKDKGMDASSASLPALASYGKNEMDVSTASLPTIPSEEKDPSMRRVREDLTTSFSAFDKLLESKSPSQDEHDDDEYSEYEIEEVVDNKAEEMRKMRNIVADMDRKLGLVPGATSDDEESFMEYTVRDEIEEFTVNEVDIDELSASRERAMTPTAEVDIDELSEQRHKEEVEKDKTKQPASAIPRIIRPQGKRPLNRKQSTESSYVEMTVTDETRKGDAFQKQASMMSLGGNFPTINVNALDDDEMTQLTMDHTLEGATSVTQDHRLADAYLNKSNEKPLKSLSPPRSKYGLGSSSQNTDPTRETVPMDESSYSQHDTGRSVDNSRDSSQAMAKSVAKILRVDMWSPKAKKVQSGMEKLAVAASQGFCQRSNINRLGGVIAIVRAMQSHPSNLQIQRSACTALAHLSVDEDSQEAIAEVGGMGAIVVAMQSHPNDHEVQESATLALANTTNPRGGGANGGGMSDSDEEDDAESSGPGVVQALVTAMNTHPNSAAVQAKAFISLANLCLDNQERLQELSESGGLTSMTMALQKPWTNKMEQHEAISTLSILLRSLAELGTSC